PLLCPVWWRAKPGSFSRRTTLAPGRNSGVIHAGIYYAPGSLKERLCREGADAIKAFCREKAVPYEKCGKLVVATNELEHRRLKDLAER
ncbi:FAD-dependent oxidoreductase, partial [Rhizobium ruizarguesonis]